MPMGTIKKAIQKQEVVRPHSKNKENWANFEIPFAATNDGNNANSSGGGGVLFEHSFESSINWHGATTPEISSFNTGDAAWVDRLIPNSISSNNDPAAPPTQPISANRRDCGCGRYHEYYQGGAGEHLSNVEWIAQRRRREQALRRRHRQQHQESQSNRGVVFRHDTSMRLDFFEEPHHHPSPFNIPTMIPPPQDGDILLASPQNMQTTTPTTPTTTATTTTADGPQQQRGIIWRRQRRGQQQPQQEQQQERRPRWRRRARQVQSTPLARRERLSHWSSSVITKSIRILTFPLRILSIPSFSSSTTSNNNRNLSRASSAALAERATDENGPSTETGYRSSVTPQLEFIMASFSDSSSSSSSSNLDSDGEWGISGPGWRWGQPDDSSSSSSGSTSHWSTGTAFLTLSGSSSSSSDDDDDDSSDEDCQHVELQESDNDNTNIDEIPDDLGFSGNPVFFSPGGFLETGSLGDDYGNDDDDNNINQASFDSAFPLAASPMMNF